MAMPRAHQSQTAVVIVRRRIGTHVTARGQHITQRPGLIAPMQHAVIGHGSMGHAATRPGLTPHARMRPVGHRSNDQSRAAIKARVKRVCAANAATNTLAI